MGIPPIRGSAPRRRPFSPRCATCRRLPRSGAPGEASSGCGRPRSPPSRTSKRPSPRTSPAPSSRWPPARGKTFTAINFIYRLIKFAGARRVLFLVDRGNLGRADPQGVPAVRLALQQLQVHRGVHRPAPDQQHPRHHGAGLHLHHPAPLLHAQGQGLCPKTWTRRSSVRASSRALQGARARRLQPGHPHRDLRRHRHRRMPPLHLQPLAAGAGVLRCLPDRPDRHAHQADLRLLQPEPGHGVRPRAGRGRRRQRQLRRLPHQDRRSPRAAPRSRPATTSTSATARPARCAGSSWTRTSSYEAKQLDRDVVAPDQIRTIVSTFRDKLFTEIFPGRTEVPKTLIFAKDDTHAEDIVKIVREEFGKGNDFAQKITYRTTGAKPEDADQGLPQQLLPAHRRHRGHDRHRHRHQAGRDRDLHAQR